MKKIFFQNVLSYTGIIIIIIRLDQIELKLRFSSTPVTSQNAPPNCFLYCSYVDKSIYSVYSWHRSKFKSYDMIICIKTSVVLIIPQDVDNGDISATKPV